MRKSGSDRERDSDGELQYEIGVGKRILATVNGVTTAYLGNYFEWDVASQSYTRYYFAGSTRIAMRDGGGALKWLLGDHLGSTSVVYDETVADNQGYKAWGEPRFGEVETEYQFTGQFNQAEIGLYYFNARWYDSMLGRFISPDPIIPEPYKSLAYDRYQYVYSNPVRYTDISGHCIDGITTWACIAIIGGIVLKAIDYVWTAYDTYQSGKVLVDPNASIEDKMFASLNVGLAIIFEAAEPDDLLPAGLPLDDAGRLAVMSGAREAFEEGGIEALEKFLRDNLGDSADDVLKKLDDALGISNVSFPTQSSQLEHIFRDATGHLAEDTLANRNLIINTISWDNYIMTDKFGNQVFARTLDDGTEVWALVRNGIIQNAG
jgi:RHS repeat-associated protein